MTATTGACRDVGVTRDVSWREGVPTPATSYGGSRAQWRRDGCEREGEGERGRLGSACAWGVLKETVVRCGAL